MSNQYKNTWFQQEFSLIHCTIDTYYILTSISPLKDAPYTKIFLGTQPRMTHLENQKMSVNILE